MTSKTNTSEQAAMYVRGDADADLTDRQKAYLDKEFGSHSPDEAEQRLERTTWDRAGLPVLEAPRTMRDWLNEVENQSNSYVDADGVRRIRKDVERARRDAFFNQLARQDAWIDACEDTDWDVLKAAEAFPEYLPARIINSHWLPGGGMFIADFGVSEGAQV